MLLTQKIEREYRFRLALRMGLPIFALIIALISHTFISSYENLSASFYIESILVLVFSIYFIFYLIYHGFDTKITQSNTNAFTREYLYKYLEKEIKNNKEYTLILISCDNIVDINTRYGIKNSDRVLKELSLWISQYLDTKDIRSYPFGHIKSGDFVVGLKGSKEQFSTIMELMCLKSDDLMVDDIEVKISGAINDMSYSRSLDYLIENLFEIQEQNRKHKIQTSKYEEISPNELESFVISAISNRSFEVKQQFVFNEDKKVIKECFVKLKTPSGKLLHQKSYMKVLDKLRLMAQFDMMILKYNIKASCAENDEIFAINISPTSLRNYKFLNELKELLEKNTHLKKRVMFLLYEREYYSRIDKYKDILDTLREQNVLICIDKVGASHASFLYFRELDVDAIRFDTHYTKNIDQRDLNILSGFIKMAHDRDIKTWVKMVENKESYNKLKKIGIDYVQGNYLSKLEELK